ncbi:MAG: hypothetical protein LBQ38_08720 [Spirochaetaceae bacterium]|nr:hypothetical protein [Spirochaetaceae bacterium]
MNTGKTSPIAAFFDLLKTGGPDRASTAWFLRELGLLPPDSLPSAPVLAGLAALRAGSLGEGPVRGRLERRHIRIRFVQEELGKLDFNKAGAGAGFGDFVFSQTDFSIYKKIDPETFTLFSGAGPADYGDLFFENTFRLNRKAVQTIIAGAYREAGSCYVIKDEKLLRNPLILSILRSLHTSLDFAPLITEEELLGECSALNRAAISPARPFSVFFSCLLEVLDGVKVVQGDGMRTELSLHAGEGAQTGGLILRGTFHPHNKAYTIPLAASKQL